MRVCYRWNSVVGFVRDHTVLISMWEASRCELVNHVNTCSSCNVEGDSISRLSNTGVAKDFSNIPNENRQQIL